MEEALVAGARRRALALTVATPPPKGQVKRVLKGSPSEAAPSVSTVTPEAKRLLRADSSSAVSVASSGKNAEDAKAADLLLAATQIDQSSQRGVGVGGLGKNKYMCVNKKYVYILYIYIYYIII